MVPFSSWEAACLTILSLKVNQLIINLQQLLNFINRFRWREIKKLKDSDQKQHADFRSSVSALPEICRLRVVCFQSKIFQESPDAHQVIGIKTIFEHV